MWERELKIIESLGKLCPEFYCWDEPIIYKEWQGGNFYKARWVHFLCMDYLDQRLPRLEEFIKINDCHMWIWYKNHFKITDEQCGKKN